jgi:hypothetical protein
MILLASSLLTEAEHIATEVGGLPGAIIGTLMTVIGALVATIVFMQRRADKIYGYRLVERDVLNKALSEASAAMHAQTQTTRERNEIMEELADTIRQSTNVITMMVERMTIQHEHMTLDQSKTGMVIAAIADAMRNNTMQMTGVKQSTDNLASSLPNVIKEIRDLCDRMLNDVRSYMGHRRT